jgi:hydroxypyruvate isomerase
MKKGLMTAASLPFYSNLTSSNAKPGEQPFRMKFSPEFGIFADLAGNDIIDQIKWGYDQGFRAWENTMLKNRAVSEQEKISQTVQSLGMEFGQFVGTLTFKDVTFAGRDKSLRDNVLADVKASVDIAKRMHTKFVHNVLGMSDPKLPWGLSNG